MSSSTTTLIEKYPDYFQKSMFFLYPLLRLNKKVNKILPKNTFLEMEGYIEPGEYKLICVFHTDDEDFFEFEQVWVSSNKQLFDKLEIGDLDVVVYVFDLSEFKEDFDLFLEGKYSKMSPEVKNKIMQFYEYGTLTYEYVKSFLYPEDYYSTYSQILSVDETLLRSNVELCSPYDSEKECFKFSEKDLDVTSTSS